MKLPSLSIVTLAYNEVSIIETTLRQLVSVGALVADDLEVIVVLHEASSDGTRRVVESLAGREPRIRIVLQPSNRSGYGHAFRQGIYAAECEYVFQTDADGQFDYDELVRAVACLPGYDYVHFNRANRKDGWERRLTGRCFYYLVRVAAECPGIDFDSAFKLFRRDLLDRIELRCRSGVLVPEFVIKAQLIGARICVGSTEHRPRLGGQPAWEVKPRWLPLTLPNPRIVLENLRDLAFLRRELRAFRSALAAQAGTERASRAACG